MTWLNESELEELAFRSRGTSFEPYADFLLQWRDIVNRNSDGWCYWAGGTRPAAKLSELLTTALPRFRGRDSAMVLAGPELEALKRALSPIKACATRHKLPQPVLRDANKIGLPAF